MAYEATITRWLSETGEVIGQEKVSAWNASNDDDGQGGIYVALTNDDADDVQFGLRITEDALREMGFVPADDGCVSADDGAVVVSIVIE